MMMLKVEGLDRNSSWNSSWPLTLPIVTQLTVATNSNRNLDSSVFKTQYSTPKRKPINQQPRPQSAMEIIYKNSKKIPLSRQLIQKSREQRILRAKLPHLRPRLSVQFPQHTLRILKCLGYIPHIPYHEILQCIILGF